MPLYLGNTNQFMVRGYRDPLITPKSSSYLNSPSVATFDVRTLPNGGGTSVASGSLIYVTGSNGDYVLTIPYTTSYTLGDTYYVSCILRQTSNGTVVQFKAEQALVAMMRTGHTPNQ